MLGFDGCSDCCETVECDVCTGGSMPAQFLVHVAGVLAGSCSDCSTYVNGSFILNPITAGNYCHYIFYNTPYSDCARFYWRELHLLFYTTGGKSAVRVYWAVGPTVYATWDKVYESKPDCSTFDVEAIPLTSHEDSYCDASAADVFISAAP